MDNNIQPRTQQNASFNERRKKADWVTKMATVLSFFSWIVSFAVVILLDQAKPEKENLFTRRLGTSIRDYWDTTFLPIAFALLIVSLCACVFAFIFNMLRMRRKTDKYRKSIIISGIVTICGIVFFVIRFGIV